jgi:hypothetical protein
VSRNKDTRSSEQTSIHKFIGIGIGIIAAECVTIGLFLLFVYLFFLVRRKIGPIALCAQLLGRSTFFPFASL